MIDRQQREARRSRGDSRRPALQRQISDCQEGWRLDHNVNLSIRPEWHELLVKRLKWRKSELLTLQISMMAGRPFPFELDTRIIPDNIIPHRNPTLSPKLRSLLQRIFTKAFWSFLDNPEISPNKGSAVATTQGLCQITGNFSFLFLRFVERVNIDWCAVHVGSSSSLVVWWHVERGSGIRTMVAIKIFNDRKMIYTLFSLSFLFLKLRVPLLSRALSIFGV